MIKKEEEVSKCFLLGIKRMSYKRLKNGEFIEFGKLGELGSYFRIGRIWLEYWRVG